MNSKNLYPVRLYALTIFCVVIVALAFVAFGGKSSTPTTTTTTTNLNAQWATWKENVYPVVNQAQADYTQTTVALSNNNTASATKYLANLSTDAATLSKYVNSPDPVANTDVQNLVSAIQSLATDGINAVTASTSLATFQADVSAYANASTALSNQIATDASKY